MTPTPGSSGSPPLVLIVDDAHDDRQMYTTYLGVHGFRVETAADGEQALRMVRMARPDVIVMDLSLPHLDGWEATRRLKHDPATTNVPVVALTGHVENRSVERALEAGCDAYVVKPVSAKGPSARVTPRTRGAATYASRALRGRGRRRAARLRSTALRLVPGDPTRHRIRSRLTQQARARRCQHPQRGARPRDHLATAMTMYREMGMTYWLEQAEVELRRG